MTLDKKIHEHIYSVLELHGFYRYSTIDELGVCTKTLRKYIHTMKAAGYKFPKDKITKRVRFTKIPTNYIEWIKHKYIFEVLEKNHFARPVTAKELGIALRTLQNQIIAMQKFDYEIPAALAGRRPGADFYECKCFPTNEERLRHLNSKKNF